MSTWRWAARASALFGLYGLCLLPFSKAAIEIAFGFLLGGWLVEQWVSGGRGESLWRTRRIGPVGFWLLAYTAWCGMSAFWSVGPHQSLNGFVRKTLEYTLFFVIASDLGRDARVVRRALVCLAFGALLIGLDCLVQQLLGRDLLFGISRAEFTQISGPFENPNGLSIYLTLSALCTVGVALGRPLGWRVGWWAVAGLLALCLIWNGSDAAEISFFAGLILLGWLHPPARKGLALTGLALVVLLGHKLGRQAGIILGLSRDFDSGWFDRTGMWATAVNMIRVRPWLGLGLNTFMMNYMHFVVGKAREPKYAHNTLLQITAETGLIGAALFVAFVAAALWVWIRAARRTSNTDPNRWLLVGPICALAAFLLHSLAETSFYSLRHASLFWVLAGLVTGRSLAAVAQPAAATTPAFLTRWLGVLRPLEGAWRADSTRV